MVFSEQKERTLSKWKKDGEPRPAAYYNVVGCPVKKIRFGRPQDFDRCANMPEKCTEYINEKAT